MQRMPDIGLKNLLAQDYANDDIPFNDFTPVSSFASKNDYQPKNGVWAIQYGDYQGVSFHDSWWLMLVAFTLFLEVHCLLNKNFISL